MSSPEARFSRRVLLGALPLALAACGFQPMHGSGAGGDALDGIVAVQTPAGRNGFALREALERRLGRAGPEVRWQLMATLELTESGLAITEDSSTTRYVMRGKSTWSLLDAAGEPSLSGEVETMSAYSATGSLYATRSARRAAQRRVATDLGERIATRLAAALADGRGDAMGAAMPPAGG
jgi:LPS-assembly lipoprotein